MVAVVSQHSAPFGNTAQAQHSAAFGNTAQAQHAAPSGDTVVTEHGALYGNAVREQHLAVLELRLLVQHEAPYGFIIKTQHSAPYESLLPSKSQHVAAYEIQLNTKVPTQHEAFFGNALKIEHEAPFESTQVTKAQHEAPFENAIPVQSQHQAPYESLLTGKAQHSAPYANRIDAVAQHTAGYSLLDHDPISSQHSAPYSGDPLTILDSAHVAVIIYNGTEYKVESFDLTHDQTEYLIRAEIEFGSTELFQQLVFDTDFILKIKNDNFNLRVYGRGKTLTSNVERTYGIVGVSKAVQYGPQKHASIDAEYTAPILASTLVQNLLPLLTISWEFTDWTIPAYRYGISEQTPMAAVQDLVERCGAVIMSKPNGDLVVRPLFPVSVPDFYTTTPDFEINDETDVYSSQAEEELTNKTNKIRITDQSLSKAIEVEAETLSDGVGIIKVFTHPWDTTISLIANQVGNEFNITNKRQLIEQTTDNDAFLEIVDGSVNVSKFIYALDEVTWHSPNIGLVIVDGKELRSISGDYGLITIKYRFRYWAFDITGPAAKVQVLVDSLS